MSWSFSSHISFLVSPSTDMCVCDCMWNNSDSFRSMASPFFPALMVDTPGSCWQLTVTFHVLKAEEIPQTLPALTTIVLFGSRFSSLFPLLGFRLPWIHSILFCGDYCLLFQVRKSSKISNYEMSKKKKSEDPLLFVHFSPLNFHHCIQHLSPGPSQRLEKRGKTQC